MPDEDFIRLVIKEAKTAEKQGSLSISSIITKNDGIIAKGWSSAGQNDPSGHNDMNAIRFACKTLDKADLSDCTMYTIIEPCSMCLGCASWVGLSKIVFGAYQEDISGNSYEISNYHAEEHAKRLTPWNGKKVEVIGGVLRQECKKLMKGVRGWTLIQQPITDY
jgi:tRNA(adenine34) deaminase